MAQKRSRSALKRARQAERRREHNRPLKTRLRSALKRLERVRTRKTALKRFLEIQPVIDKSVKAGIIHPRAGARLKSRLMRRILKLK